MGRPQPLDRHLNTISDDFTLIALGGRYILYDEADEGLRKFSTKENITFSYRLHNGICNS